MRKRKKGWSAQQSKWPTAGPKPWKTSIGVPTNVFRKPKRKGFKSHGFRVR